MADNRNPNEEQNAGTPKVATSNWATTWAPVITNVVTVLIAVIGVLVAANRQLTKLEERVQHHSDIFNDIRTSKADSKELNQTFVTVENYLTEHKSQITELRSKVDALMQATQANTTNVQGFTKELDSLRCQRDKLEEQITSLRERLARMEASQPANLQTNKP